MKARARGLALAIVDVGEMVVVVDEVVPAEGSKVAAIHEAVAGLPVGSAALAVTIEGSEVGVRSIALGIAGVDSLLEGHPLAVPLSPRSERVESHGVRP
jgi:hypothetical protein